MQSVNSDKLLLSKIVFILPVKISLFFENCSNKYNFDKGVFKISICNNSLSPNFLAIY